jgi:hypothetical protein
LLEPGTLVGNSTEHYRIVVSHPAVFDRVLAQASCHFGHK